MKSFITRFLFFTFLALLPAPLIILMNHHLASRINWRLPAQKHIVFIGASLVAYGIDDSMTESAINLANGGERYMFTFLKLRKILENNAQIDTVFLECAPTDMFEHADDKYFRNNEMSEFYAKFYPLFGFEQWKLYKKNIPDAFSLIYRETIWDYIKGIDYRYFISDFPPHTRIMKKEAVHKELMDGEYGNEINYEYLRKIIQLCKDKHVKLYLLYTPVYKPEYLYDQEYYYDAYRKHFSDVELLDYSHFPIADEERYDTHHLNDNGAVTFTNEIKRRFHIK